MKKVKCSQSKVYTTLKMFKNNPNLFIKTNRISNLDSEITKKILENLNLVIEGKKLSC